MTEKRRKIRNKKRTCLQTSVEEVGFSTKEKTETIQISANVRVKSER